MTLEIVRTTSDADIAVIRGIDPTALAGCDADNPCPSSQVCDADAFCHALSDLGTLSIAANTVRLDGVDKGSVGAGAGLTLVLNMPNSTAACGANDPCVALSLSARMGRLELGDPDDRSAEAGRVFISSISSR